MWNRVNRIGLGVIESQACQGQQCKQQGWYLVLNQGCEGQVVKQVREILPHVRVAVLPQAFVVEAIAAQQQGRASACDTWADWGSAMRGLSLTLV